jgi:hypothetical protein
MAKLGRPYPFPEYDSRKDFRLYMKEQDEALSKIPEDKIIDFPVADGKALYFVKSFEPLVLQHIDYLDGYAIPDAHIRGLRRNDVEELLRRGAVLRELFSRQ